MPLDASESIARAICSDKWDPETGLLSPSLFKGENTSVSRLSNTPLEQTWDLFRHRVARPPERQLEPIGEIGIGKLQVVGQSYEPSPTELTVEADPLDGYPSHAVIPQKISRGLANQIVRALEIHSPPHRQPGGRE